MKANYFLFIFSSLLITGCFSTSKVTYQKIENLKVKKIGISNITLATDVLLLNENNSGVTIKEINADIFIDGEEVGEMKQVLNTKMPANSEFRLPLEFQFPTDKVVKNVGDILGSFLKDKTINVRMKGVITVNVLGKGIPIPFSEEEKLSLK